MTGMEAGVTGARGKGELVRLDARRRPPVWMQVGLGCGVALVLMLAILAGGGYLVYRKGTGVMDRAWKELRTTTERLRTVESTRALYRGNPGLAEIYATEGDFLKVVEGWRPKLGDVPESRPSLRDLLRDQETVQVHRNSSDGHETVRMKFKFATGAVLVMETDQGKLTNLLLK
jgi:hypothetical protein